MRSSFALAATSLALLVPAATASAWKAETSKPGGGTLTYTAAPGEVNKPKLVRVDALAVRIDDAAGTASAGPHCAATEGSVGCPFSSLVRFLLGDRSDIALVGDEIASSSAYVNVHGGDGNDTISNQGTPGALNGGAGTDVVRPGPDKDTVVGGPGLDAIDYSDRSAPVSVMFATDKAVQGEAGEEDTMAEIEAVFSGSGADDLKGYNQDEQFVPGDGEDSVDTGGGKDIVDARDGFEDTIECGLGDDTVLSDQRDVVAASCEHVHLKHTLAGDAQGFGQTPPSPDDVPSESGDVPAGGGTPGGEPSGGAGAPGGEPGAGGAPGGGAAPADTVAPVLSSVRLSRGTIRRGGPRRGRATALRLALSETATVTVAIERCTATRRPTRRCALPTRVGAVRRAGLSGAAAIRLTATLPGRMLRAGRYRLRIVAVDAAGNRSKAVTRRLVVKR